MTLHGFVELIVAFVREHETWAAPIAFGVAFLESFCFLSIIWPGTAILMVSGFFYLNFDALTSILGYASPDRLPERFVFHSAVVVQPNKSSGEKGTIYVWATALNKEGLAQLGTATEPTPREGANAVSRLLSSRNNQRLKLQDMPDPALPEK